jgi:dTDP-4-amino-4,6-dideoxygalactose transaminase
MVDLPFLPYGKPVLEKDDIEAVTAVLESDFLTMGPQVGAFEQAFADATAAPHAISCSSGTAALHLATMALGIGPGVKVIVPTMTFLATANAVRMAGGEVVFADVDPKTGLMGMEQLQEAAMRAGGSVKAVYPVHMAGRLTDMAALSELAAAKGWSVVEDCCHALGGRYRTSDGQEGHVGDCRYSDAAVFSFHPTKTIASGEGGIVTCGDAELRDRMLLLRNHGMTRNSFANRDLAFDAGPGIMKCRNSAIIIASAKSTVRLRAHRCSS